MPNRIVKIESCIFSFYLFLSFTVLPEFEVSVELPSFGLTTDERLLGTVRAEQVL